jgi:DNA-binding transcriptional MerR regulator
MEATTSSPARYPIRVASRLTGIPIDTLRAWERRYGVVEPRRDDRGRLYTEGDVKRLKLLRALVEHGHAIGRVARLPEVELAALLEGGSAPAVEEAGGPGPLDLGPVLAAVGRFDAPGTERELARLAAILPARDLVHRVALPLMRQVGEEWEAGRLTVGQEHLVSSTLRNLLGSLMRLSAPREPRASLLFATPPGERHEFGILAGAMLAVAGGLGAVYMGADLPAAEILLVARRTSVRAVVLALSGASSEAEGLAAIRQVARGLTRGTALWVGGAATPALAARIREAGATFLEDLAALEAAMRRLGARY